MQGQAQLLPGDTQASARPQSRLVGSAIGLTLTHPLATVETAGLLVLIEVNLELPPGFNLLFHASEVLCPE